MRKKFSVAGLIVGIVIALSGCEQGPGSTESAASPHTSRIFTVRASDFVIAEVPGVIASVAGIEYSMPEVTKEAVDKGLVQAHVEIASEPGAWHALPLSVTLSVGTIDISISMTYGYGEGIVALLVTGNVTRSQLATLLSVYDGYRLRVVVGR